MSDYDMVVVGSGFAGSAAALSFLEEAEKSGRVGRVALIESGDLGRWPGGSRWARPFLALDRDNTLLGDRAGGVERVVSSPRQWRRFEEEVPGTVEFMKDHGVIFIHREEKDAAMDFEGQGFVFLGSGGKEIVDFLLEHIMRHDSADILYGREATELTLGDDGRAAGVVVNEPDGSQRTITADAVVLACGGFEGSPEMLAEHVGEGELPLIARGLRYNRGAGVRMAVDAGADMDGQADMFHAELVDTRAERYHSAVWGMNYGIVVNGDSERFHDEGADYVFGTSEAIAYETWRNQDQSSYFVTDKPVMERFEGSWVYGMTNEPPEESDTIAGLAGKLGLDPAKLEATVDEFNAACGDGEWNPVGMDGKKTSGVTPPKSNWAAPIVEAPFFGYPMTAHLSFTFGGLKVDEDGRVTSTGGAAIPGLFAAGEITGLFHNKQSPATSALRSCAFGRLIGESVAKSLPKPASI